MINLKIDVHVMVILATRTFRERKKNNNMAESFTRLYLNNVSVDVDNRERARARFEKQRRRISLETQAENFKVR